MARWLAALALTVALVGSGCKDSKTTPAAGTPTGGPGPVVTAPGATTPGPSAQTGDDKAVAAVKKKLLGRWKDAAVGATVLEFKENGDLIRLTNMKPNDDYTHTYSVPDERTLIDHSYSAKDKATVKISYEIAMLTDTELVLMARIGEDMPKIKYVREK